MKKYLVAAVCIAAAGVGTAGAQTFTAPVGERRPETARRPPPVVYEPVVTGAVPRAARGNPLQMLNPGAPDQYRGPVEDTVTYDPDNPSRVTGIILFGLRW